MDKENPNTKQKKQKNQKSKFALYWKWPLIVLVLALTLSFSFGVLSQYALSGAGIAVSIVVICVFIIISIIADMIGVATTAAQMYPFRAMAAKKVRGAKEAIKLVENAEKVASVAADIIGDICGILSGAAGASVAAAFIFSSTDQFVAVLIASAVSALIAALTIFGKAMFKRYAMIKSDKIVLAVGKVISIFHCSGKKKPFKKNKKEEKKIGIEKENQEEKQD